MSRDVEASSSSLSDTTDINPPHYPESGINVNGAAFKSKSIVGVIYVTDPITVRIIMSNKYLCE